MKKILVISLMTVCISTHLRAQSERDAGTWKTWFISSGKDYRLPAPQSYKNEIDQVLAAQKNLDSAGWQQIMYWNAGSPGYRWESIIPITSDTSNNGVLVLANMLLKVAIYDATVAAWNTKYAYNRPRPFAADKRIKCFALKPESPSYPCEYSVAAGVAVTIISHFYPSWSDSINQLAQQQMKSRVAAGLAFPDDTRAGFELGKTIAEKEIEHTKDFVPKTAWDGKMPDKPGIWKGKFAMFPLAAHNKTVVLDSASEFRPGPPPDFAKDMAELKSFKQTFRSMSNAFFWASHDFWSDILDTKMFEYNIQLDPPRAARLYAISAIGLYDGFVSCFDAKYAYWGIRPNQYDTSFHPALLVTPPFPGYPSGHATVSGVMAELYSYFFPAEAAYFRKKAKEGAESRFQAGIHFRTDNEVGLDLGRKVANAIIQKVKDDGAGNDVVLAHENDKQ
ncbi:MAG TPA: phosphatase PAP2 family protein [Parafilimonas sp.]|nr:phosphatase PAP2 family protein [Parafilimonas sp.]